MPPSNHVQVDPSVFDPANIPQDTVEFNQKLMDIMRGAPKWYEVSLRPVMSIFSFARWVDL